MSSSLKVALCRRYSLGPTGTIPPGYQSHVYPVSLLCALHVCFCCGWATIAAGMLVGRAGQVAERSAHNCRGHADVWGWPPVGLALRPCGGCCEHAVAVGWLPRAGTALEGPLMLTQATCQVGVGWGLGAALEGPAGMGLVVGLVLRRTPGWVHGFSRDDSKWQKWHLPVPGQVGRNRA